MRAVPSASAVHRTQIDPPDPGVIRTSGANQRESSEASVRHVHTASGAAFTKMLREIDRTNRYEGHTRCGRRRMARSDRTGWQWGARRSGARRRGSARAGLPGLPLTREVRDDPEQALDDHELRAVMHLM